MNNSITIYTENKEQSTAIKAILLELEISFKENSDNNDGKIKVENQILK